MKRQIVVSALLVSALVIPLTIIAVRNFPFWQVPAFGEEKSLQAIAGLACDQVHPLSVVFDRIQSVEQLNARRPELNRKLETREWSYDAGRHLLTTTVQEPVGDKHRAFLSSSYFLVTGVMKKTYQFSFPSFTGSAKEIFVSLTGERRAIPDVDYRYDPQTKVVTLNRDLKVFPLMIVFWDTERLQYFEKVYGGSNLDFVGELETNNPVLTTELDRFKKKQEAIHSAAETFALEKADTLHPQLVRRVLTDTEQSARLSLAHSEVRSLPIGQDRAHSRDLGFSASAPKIVDGLTLRDLKLREYRQGEKVSRTASFSYFSDRSRVVVDAQAWSSEGTRSVPLVDQRTLTIAGKAVERIEYWEIWNEDFFPVPQIMKETVWIWHDDKTRWSTWSHEALVAPHRDMEGFIKEFIQGGV